MSEAPDPTSAATPTTNAPTGTSAATPTTSVPAAASTPTSAPTSVPADGGSAVVPADVPEALRFSAPLLGGGDIEMATLAGRPVLLWFWSPW